MKITKFVTAVTSVLVILFFFYSCEKSGKTDPPGTHPNETVNADVYGRVLDENNVPVQNATVKTGNASSTTDVNGYFRFRNTALDKANGFIKVEKEGYFQGSRTFTPNAATTNYVSIKLIKKFLSGTFTATSGGSITIPSGGTINFPANGIVSGNNHSAYAGNVSVYAYFINPQAANFRDIMPGALRGVNTNNEVTGLKSYGMMAVELVGAGGEQLQLASGKSATITFPIPSKLQTDAPATIPLWHFNDTTGVWKQEGSAAKQGTNYVGTVSHFSFWNCDDPFQIIDWLVTIKDQGGNPVRFSEVVLQVVGDTTNSGSGFTDSTGKTGGQVPMNKAMLMKVYNRCGTVIHSQQIGPFAADTDMGAITVNNPTPIVLTITGTAVNCTGGAVTNGVVNVLLDGKNNRTVVNNGNFSITIERCEATSATAKLQATDLGSSQQGPVVNVSVTTGTANGGQLSACGSAINQFINYNIFGTSYVLLPGDYMNAARDGGIYISGSLPNQQNYISFNFPGTAIGTFVLNSVYIYTTKPYYKNGTININITEYGNKDEYIAGNFSGNIKDTTSGAIGPIVCSFRLKKSW